MGLELVSVGLGQFVLCYDHSFLQLICHIMGPLIVPSVAVGLLPFATRPVCSTGRC